MLLFGEWRLQRITLIIKALIKFNFSEKANSVMVIKKDWIVNTTIFIYPVFTFGLMDNGAGSSIFFLFYTYLIAIFISAIPNIPKHFNKSPPTLIWMLAWILVSFFSVIWSIDPTRWLITVAQIFAIGSLLILAFDKRVIYPNFIAFIPIILFTIAFGFMSALIPDDLLAIYSSSNILGIIMYTNVLFLVWGATVIGNKFFRAVAFITIIVAFWLMLFSETRSVLIGVGFSLITYFLLKIKNKIIPCVIIYGVFIASALFVFYYIESSQVDKYSELETTESKKAYSGRESIWPVVIKSIYDAPIFGHGAGVEPTSGKVATNELDSHYIGLSAHNHHLQLLYQIGFLGFIPFFMFIKKFFYALVKKKSLLGASFLIGIIFQQNFEVLLTQNNLILGIPLWVTIIANFKSLALNR